MSLAAGVESPTITASACCDIVQPSRLPASDVDAGELASGFVGTRHSTLPLAV
jgi:hypothetical protein